MTTRSITLSVVVLCATAGAAAEKKPVQIEMRNVRLHSDERILLDVHRLRGTMISQTDAGVPIFDDSKSYIIDVAAAEIAVDITSLQNLMNEYVLAGEKAPLKEVQLAVKDGRIELKGKLHKGITVPFSATTSVGVTDEGQMKLHVESMKAVGVPAKGLLSLFGLQVADLMKLTKDGVTVSENDIILDPGRIVPPPQIRGKLTKVAVTANGLLQTFGDPDTKRLAPLKKPSPTARNYIYFGHGVIRFGKLTMTDADLQLIDADPSDPFDFFPARYNDQLVAGYSKNTPEKGLKTYMPDYEDVRRPARRLDKPSS